MAALCGDGRAQWLADLTVGDPPRFNPRCLLAWDPGIEAVPPDDLPTCRLFPSVHLAAFRLKLGPRRDLSGVQRRFERVVALPPRPQQLRAGLPRGEAGDRSRPWPYTPDYWTSVEPPQSTAWHNTITVDGGDQRMPPRYRMSFDLDEAGDGWCALSEFQVGDGWASCVGDASNAYGDTLARFRRTVVFLPPDAVLILDDMVLREVRHSGTSSGYCTPSTRSSRRATDRGPGAASDVGGPAAAAAEVARQARRGPRPPRARRLADSLAGVGLPDRLAASLERLAEPVALPAVGPAGRTVVGSGAAVRGAAGGHGAGCRDDLDGCGRGGAGAADLR
ncbi:MAG: heparinase II/III family protein [Gammaproteobacteria bacterium]|nr:heparinase II/III family protein [Gammaproteobacteria bacterium]